MTLSTNRLTNRRGLKERAKIDGIKTAGETVGALLGAYVMVGLIVLGSFFYMIGKAID